MNFVIRDDDLSFYTDISKLKNLYDPVFKMGFKVSFAVIPRNSKTINIHNRRKYYQSEERSWIGENRELMKYIQPLVENNYIEIMLHGYDHKYEIKEGKFIGECIQKNKLQLYQDLKEGKAYLEKVFTKNIYSFVPPSNQIDGKAIQILKQIGIKYLSGTITPTYNRKISLINTHNWLLYISHFLLHRTQYPFIMKEDRIKAITYYSINLSSKTLINKLSYCQKKGAPFVLLVHHWELYSNKKLKIKFYNFLSEVKKNNFKLLQFHNIFE